MPVEILYPSSRPDRGESAPSAGVGPSISVPRARLWPFLLGCSGAARTTVVSFPIQTPCMIWEVVSNWPQLGSGGGGFALLYATDDGGEVTAGAVTKPSGTPIFDPADFRSNTVTEADEIPEHLSMVGEGGTVTLPYRFNFRKIIEVPGPIFLKATIRTNAGELRIRGGITIFEAATVEDLLNFR